MTVKHIILAFLLATIPLLSFASEFYITTSDLNVRAGAGSAYPVSFTLLKGDEVEILSKENNWYKINYAGKIGYVNSKYLNYSRSSSEPNIEQPQQKTSYFPITAIICFVIIVIFFLSRKTKIRYAGRIIKKSKNRKQLERGTASERELFFTLLKFGMPEHRIFHDLYIEKQKNYFSQIDLVAITDVGIIVFEVKDYSGWIYGRGNQTQWTQVLNFGNQKYRFYNPIMQNNGHIAEIKKHLMSLNDIPVYSVVVFYGDCELREISFVPRHTYIVKSNRIVEVMHEILKDNKPIQYANESEMLRLLKNAVTKGSDMQISKMHIENIKDMLGKHRVFD